MTIEQLQTEIEALPEPAPADYDLNTARFRVGRASALKYGLDRVHVGD